MLLFLTFAFYGARRRVVRATHANMPDNSQRRRSAAGLAPLAFRFKKVFPDRRRNARLWRRAKQQGRCLSGDIGSNGCGRAALFRRQNQHPESYFLLWPCRRADVALIHRRLVITRRDARDIITTLGA